MSKIPAELAEWLARMTRVERIRVLGTLTDYATSRELARIRRADIAAELRERGHGGRKSLAAELGIVRPSTLSEAVRQHRQETEETPMTTQQTINPDRSGWCPKHGGYLDHCQRCAKAAERAAQQEESTR